MLDAEDTLKQLTQLLRDVLGNESVELSMETVRSDVVGWDSFNYITFMVVVESHFGVKFRVSDIEEFPNVGAIVQKIIELKK